ncbi:hypothetical protein B296_00020964 [Ensete ventricosum]|uniref:Uncharacterized protein n=1 Tax=Ensete ventricosum TaxID=4639 RepID=A0A426ZFA0_ENSVE|nr:hypothetical protein B296_00020964 [Ensete ventricosum]
MGLLGQRAVSNPSAVLSALVSKRDNLQDELRVIERQVGPPSLAFCYLFFLFPLPHVSFRLKNMLLVGMILFLVNFLILKMMYCFMINLVKSFYSKVHVADRYHLYSIVSRGKPKKGGRIALREGKRLRPSIEQDLDDEEDLDIV